MIFLKQIYLDTFESIHASLENQKNEKAVIKQDIVDQLNSLYDYQGCSQSGKSEIQQAKLSASIAAHEAILANW